MVSLCNAEGYQHDYDLLINKGPRPNRFGGRSRSYERYVKQKTANSECFMKTVPDAQKNLTKKHHKRLLADQSDGFRSKAIYSLNKRKRWETVTSGLLLNSHLACDHDTCVVNQTLTLSSLYSPSYNTSVTSMQILDGDSLTTVSSGGRPLMIRDFNKRLAELLEMSRAAILPRVHINIFTPTRFSRYHNNHFSKVYEDWCRTIWRKAKQRDAKEIMADDYDFHNEISDVENLPGSDQAQSDQSQRNLTFGDFFCEHSTTRRTCRRNSRRGRKGDSSPELRIFKNSSALLDLFDISNVINSHYIFEIVDVSLKNLGSINLQEEVAHLLPEYCTLQCFGDERVSIRSKPTDKPFFVLFFEIKEKQQKLRIRINTNTPYPNTAGRDSLLQILQTCKDFISLFNSLIQFIFKTVEKVPDQEGSRCQMFKDAFIPANNSETLASTAESSSEMDKLNYIEPHYSPDDFEVVSRPQEDPAVCYQCRSHYHTDLFLTIDGMMCRECAASFLIHQLRLSRFPVELNLLSPNDHPLYLLHAILPVPFVSLIIKMSYNYLYKEQLPDALFVQCPQCSASLTLPHRNEYNICSCPECACHWCYLCGWEPHWPMNCNEFKKWSKKWDKQYFFEKFNLDEDERLLSIKCCCDNTFYVPEHSAHGAACPARNCTATYDKQGVMRCGFRVNWNWHFRWQPRRRQHIRCQKENGLSVTPKVLVPKKLIRKEFANICAAARSDRFNDSKRLEFEEAVFKIYSCKIRTRKLKELRTTVLLLVENCTAWLYLHRSEKHTAARSLIGQLLQSFMNFQNRVFYSSAGLLIQEEKVRRSVTKLLTAFQRCTKLHSLSS